MIKQTKDFKTIVPFFIHAIYKDSPIIEWLSENRQYNKYSTDIVIDTKAEMACFLSHLKALRYFVSLKNDSEWGVICEDDVIFHQDFEKALEKLIMMAQHFDGFVALSYYGIKDVMPGYMKIVEPFHLGLVAQTFTGAYCYLVSKQSAIKLLEHFDRPFRYLCCNTVCSENIVRMGCSMDMGDHYRVVFPPMAIECSTDSSIRTNTDHHREYFQRFENKLHYKK